MNERKAVSGSSIASSRPTYPVMELLLAPLAWLLALTGIGMLTPVVLENNPTVIGISALLTVGLAVARVLGLVSSFSTLATIVVVFAAMKSRFFDATAAGYTVGFALAAYWAVPFMSGAAFAAVGKWKGAFIAAVLSVAYVAAFALYLEHTEGSVMFGVIFIGMALAIFDVLVIAAAWLMDRRKARSSSGAASG